MEYFEAKGETVVEQDARKCLGSFGLQGKIASDTPLVQLSGGQKVGFNPISCRYRVLTTVNGRFGWP
jgi:hypothetical protein